MAEELDPVLDPDVETSLRAALTRMRVDPADPVMPPAVWDRLEHAIAHESGRRMGTVVELVPRRRALRWVGPLVAVSAVVLGVMVVTNLPTESADVIASGTGVVDSPDQAPVAKAASPGALAQAGFVPPTMTIVDSAQNFTPESLRAGVSSVLEQLGIRSVADLDDMTPPPTEPPADQAALRACVTDLTASPTSQALIVIRATYQGDEVGVVVIPAVMMGNVTTLDLSQISDPTLHIFVVGPQCGAQPAQVITHVLHAVGQ